tara:strand:+ start:3880 stop:4119 length:240 start_codon:yes stop_codon:yes gene_type:complete
METIENVTIYQDFNFSKKYGEFLGSYDIEIIGEKARVIQKMIFGLPQKSRLNKLHQVGSVGDVKLYHIIANGKDAFFKK